MGDLFARLVTPPLSFMVTFGRKNGYVRPLLLKGLLVSIYLTIYSMGRMIFAFLRIKAIEKEMNPFKAFSLHRILPEKTHASMIDYVEHDIDNDNGEKLLVAVRFWSEKQDPQGRE